MGAADDLYDTMGGKVGKDAVYGKKERDPDYTNVPTVPRRGSEPIKVPTRAPPPLPVEEKEEPFYVNTAKQPRPAAAAAATPVEAAVVETVCASGGR